MAQVPACSAWVGAWVSENLSPRHSGVTACFTEWLQWHRGWNPGLRVKRQAQGRALLLTCCVTLGNKVPLWASVFLSANMRKLHQMLSQTTPFQLLTFRGTVKWDMVRTSPPPSQVSDPQHFQFITEGWRHLVAPAALHSLPKFWVERRVKSGTYTGPLDN